MRTDSRELLAIGIFGRTSRVRSRIELLLRRGRTFSSRPSAAGIVAGISALAMLLLAGSLAPRRIAFAEAPPQFEVASVHLNQTGVQDSIVNLPDTGRLSVTNATLTTLIRNAYGVQGDQIIDAPKWTETARYDIQAKTAGPIKETQDEVLLQGLLGERFHLKVHWGRRNLPFYAMILAKGGPRLKENTGPTGSMQISRTEGTSTVKTTRMSMGQLAGVLGKQTGRVVLDKTGLSGYYAFTLVWAPDEVADSAEPSIFTALQDQLGLKLKPAKGPTPVLIIDQVEKPDAN